MSSDKIEYLKNINLQLDAALKSLEGANQQLNILNLEEINYKFIEDKVKFISSKIKNHRMKLRKATLNDSINKSSKTEPKFGDSKIAMDIVRAPEITTKKPTAPMSTIGTKTSASPTNTVGTETMRSSTNTISTEKIPTKMKSQSVGTMQTETVNIGVSTMEKEKSDTLLKKSSKPKKKIPIEFKKGKFMLYKEDNQNNIIDGEGIKTPVEIYDGPLYKEEVDEKEVDEKEVDEKKEFKRKYIMYKLKYFNLKKKHNL